MRKVWIPVVAITAGFCARGADPAPSQDNAPTIGLRRTPPPLPMFLPTGFKPDEARTLYLNKVADLCRALGAAPASDEKTKSETLAALNSERGRAVEMLGYCLDPRLAPDSRVRRGALAALDGLKQSNAKLSSQLAVFTVGDPDPDQRAALLQSIKSRKDDAATHMMIQYLLGSYHQNGSVKNQIVHDNAVTALKELGDKRVYSAMLYYATIELRTAVSSLNNLTTRSIDSFQAINSGQTATIIPLSLPIQFPELSITSVKTTVVVPAAALTDLTGQDFGNDVDKWEKWIQKQ